MDGGGPQVAFLLAGLAIVVVFLCLAAAARLRLRPLVVGTVIGAIPGFGLWVAGNRGEIFTNSERATDTLVVWALPVTLIGTIVGLGLSASRGRAGRREPVNTSIQVGAVVVVVLLVGAFLWATGILLPFTP